jgi:hypothetical protein
MARAIKELMNEVAITGVDIFQRNGMPCRNNNLGRTIQVFYEDSG